MLFACDFQDLSKRIKFGIQKSENGPIFSSKVKKRPNLQSREEMVICLNSGAAVLQPERTNLGGPRSMTSKLFFTLAL